MDLRVSVRDRFKKMSRLNPLKPVGCRRTVSLETIQSNHEIQESKIRGKREAYNRKNEAYIKSLYGNQREKEEVRFVSSMYHSNTQSNT